MSKPGRRSEGRAGGAGLCPPQEVPGPGSWERRTTLERFPQIQPCPPTGECLRDCNSMFFKSGSIFSKKQNNKKQPNSSSLWSDLSEKRRESGVIDGETGMPCPCPPRSQRVFSAARAPTCLSAGTRRPARQAVSQMVLNSRLDRCPQKFWKVLLTGWPGKCFHQKRPRSLGRNMPVKDGNTEVQGNSILMEPREDPSSKAPWGQKLWLSRFWGPARRREDEPPTCSLPPAAPAQQVNRTGKARLGVVVPHLLGNA